MKSWGLVCPKSYTRFRDGIFGTISPYDWNHAKYRTTIHSDQGWHYQHTSWVKTLKRYKIFQSMSRKVTCADNAAMENFFGILKQEMYYGEELISYDALKQKIEVYIDYYNNERIKQKLAGMSPVNTELMPAN